MISIEFINEEYADNVLSSINMISLLWIVWMMWLMYSWLQAYDQRKDDYKKTGDEIK